MSSPTISNCLIAGNYGDIGGGIYCYEASPTITNCTIVNNSAMDGEVGGVYGDENGGPTIVNSIIWGNSGGQISGSQTIVTYSDVQGGHTGTGNINADPVFVRNGVWNGDSFTIGDYHLGCTSPCMDAGSAGHAGQTTSTTEPDTFRWRRRRHCQVDMGAYERRVLWVGSGQQYTKIKSAVDDAVDGDLIVVVPGTYSTDQDWNLGFGEKITTFPARTVRRRASWNRAVTRPSTRMSRRTTATVVEGFTIRGGESPTSFCVVAKVASVGLTVSSCIFYGNTSKWGTVMCDSGELVLI